jgi:CRP-like cAMP-binding protein
MEPMLLQPGTVIYHDGEIGDCMYFLSEGEVEFTLLMMSTQRQRELGLRIVSDPRIGDDGPANEVRVEAREGHTMPDDYIPAVFRWSRTHKDSITFFGEDVLSSGSGISQRKVMSLPGAPLALRRENECQRWDIFAFSSRRCNCDG